MFRCAKNNNDAQTGRWICVSLIAGLCVGAGLCYWLWALPNRHLFEDMMALEVRTSLNTLDLIEKNQVDLLQTQEAHALADRGYYISRHMRHHPGAQHWLWKIRDYFEKHEYPKD